MVTRDELPGASLMRAAREAYKLEDYERAHALYAVVLMSLWRGPKEPPYWWEDDKISIWAQLEKLRINDEIKWEDNRRRRDRLWKEEARKVGLKV